MLTIFGQDLSGHGMPCPYFAVEGKRLTWTSGAITDG